MELGGWNKGLVSFEMWQRDGAPGEGSRGCSPGGRVGIVSSHPKPLAPHPRSGTGHFKKGSDREKAARESVVARCRELRTTMG